MRMAIVPLALLLLGAAVFPPMVGGEFLFKVRPAVLELDPDGVPLTKLTGSISIVPLAGGANVGCVATPDQAPTDPYEITANVSATGVRQEFKAVAWAHDDCTGDMSEPSENTAYTYPGQSPNKPGLE